MITEIIINQTLIGWCKIFSLCRALRVATDHNTFYATGSGVKACH